MVLERKSQPYPAPVVAPAKEPLPSRPEDATDLPSHVVLYNDDYHTFEDVALQLMKAIGCSAVRGYAYAFEVHTTGRAIVYRGALIRCLNVAEILREINLRVEVQAMV